MRQTETLVVGASISGLALAACLQNKNVEYIIIEKEAEIAVPWRNHYERLHLHTNKRLSRLPFKKFSGRVTRYPSRMQVIDYLEDYQKEFSIAPIFNTEAKSIKRKNNYWITETPDCTFKSKYVVMATGPFGKPLPINFKGMETFSGKILHSCEYKTARDFKGQKVLVVGFGNSACEIAIDLFEQDAIPSMAVRSAVNIVSRDILRIPIMEISLLLSRLNPRIADAVSAPLLRLLFGDITKLGLQKKPYGPFEQIMKDGKAPVIDIGIIRHIRQDHIKIYGDIDNINCSTVYFKDGRKEDFDAIIAAIGYCRDYAEIIDVDSTRFGDLKLPVAQQKYFGKDGLYFCGFWISPTGQIRETSLDAQKIVGDISRISHKGSNY